MGKSERLVREWDVKKVNPKHPLRDTSQYYKGGPSNLIW